MPAGPARPHTARARRASRYVSTVGDGEPSLNVDVDHTAEVFGQLVTAVGGCLDVGLPVRTVRLGQGRL